MRLLACPHPACEAGAVVLVLQNEGTDSRRVPTKLCGICRKAAPGGAGTQTPKPVPWASIPPGCLTPSPPVLARRELSPPAKGKGLGTPCLGALSSISPTGTA